MKVVVLLLLPLTLALFFATASGQFGGFTRFGGVADTFRRRVGDVASRIRAGPLPLPVISNPRNFADFLAQAGKTYVTEAERRLRENLFNVRKSLVEKSNRAFQSHRQHYELALNAFADLTNAEFLKRLTGNRKSAQGEAKAKEHREMAEPSAAARLPDAFDWRERGGVTPVKFQDECGSCWSFAVAGAIEGHMFRKTGQLVSLSEQNLIDCGKEEYGLIGCDGGFQDYGFEFVIRQKGIATSDSYPYSGKKDTCGYKESFRGAQINGFVSIRPNDEQTMKKVVATLGPLACSVNGLESLLLYKRGIYDDEECNKGEVNHSVLVVGYGSDNGTDYWIVKNSWDTVWGEDGYFRLPRGKNFCGIASECSFPIV